MGNMDVFMNALIIIAGCYLIYSAFLMKTKGEVPSGFMSRDIDFSRTPEHKRKAYIKIMMPANIIMGIVMILTGGIFTLGDRLGLTGMATNIMIAAALLLCVGYGSILMHFQNKYLR